MLDTANARVVQRDDGVRPMTPMKVIEVSEFTVPVIEDADLIFRLEVLTEGRGEGRRYRCRLYRLESVRVQVREAGDQHCNTWTAADYRCWVVDDNLDIEDHRYQSIAKARNASLKILKNKLGLV